MPSHQSIGKLISIVHRKSQIYFQQKLEPLGLSHGQVKIFVFLKKNRGATQQEITRFFQLDRSSTSFLINKMCENGFIKKEINPHDGRSQKLYLTKKALNNTKKIKKIFLSWTELLLNGFSTKEKELAFQFMHRMIDNVGVINEKQNAIFSDKT